MKNSIFNGMHRRRVGAFLLALVMILGALVYIPVPASAEGAEPYSDYKVYHWKRVTSAKNLGYSAWTTVKVLLMWKNGDSWYTSTGSGSTGTAIKNYPEIDPYSSEFYTADDCNAWSLVFTGGKGDRESSMPIVNLYPKGGNKYPGDNWNFTMITCDGSSDYADEVSAGKVMFAFEDSGKDGELYASGSSLNNRWNGDYDYFNFVVYLGEEEVFTQLDDYAVPSGTTMQVKNNTVIQAGKTLIIEPGAVLAVAGNFFNNGTIENYGTLIVHTGAIMRVFGAPEGRGGSLICHGSSEKLYSPSAQKTLTGEGNVLIREDGWVVFPKSTMAEFRLSCGCTLINDGVLMINGVYRLDNAEVRVGTTGRIVYGKTLQHLFAYARECGIDAVLTDKDTTNIFKSYEGLVENCDVYLVTSNASSYYTVNGKQYGIDVVESFGLTYVFYKKGGDPVFSSVY